jgi:hypothetical protein
MSQNIRLEIPGALWGICESQEQATGMAAKRDALNARATRKQTRGPSGPVHPANGPRVEALAQGSKLPPASLRKPVGETPHSAFFRLWASSPKCHQPAASFYRGACFTWAISSDLPADSTAASAAACSLIRAWRCRCTEFPKPRAIKMANANPKTHARPY